MYCGATDDTGLSHSLELQTIVTLETCTLVGTYMYGKNGKVVCCTHVKRMVCKDLSIDEGGAAPLISKFETNGVKLERFWELESLTMICEDWEGQAKTSVLYCLCEYMSF